jgi:aminoglycoside 6'-N-acetyltransferase I
MLVARHRIAPWRVETTRPAFARERRPGVGQRYGLEIRAATAADAPGLAALMVEMGVAVPDPSALAARIEAIARMGGTVLIAVEWGPPSGVVAFQPVADLAAAHPTGLLVTLGVAPDSRRRGIGRLLVKAIARSARLAGCDRLLLPVAGRPADVSAFAAAAGFVPEEGGLVRPLLRRGHPTE